MSGLIMYGSGEGDKTEIAIPGGAGAAINGGSAGAARPLIGFQVWKPDNDPLSTLFSFAPARELAGTKRDFGSFLLTPPRPGTVVHVLPAARSVASVNGSSGEAAGGQDNRTPKAFRPSASDTNEYQFGLLTGYGLRHLTGDRSQPSAAAFRKKLVNTDRTTLRGHEIEFFVRKNQFCPTSATAGSNCTRKCPGFPAGNRIRSRCAFVDLADNAPETERSEVTAR